MKMLAQLSQHRAIHSTRYMSKQRCTNLMNVDFGQFSDWIRVLIFQSIQKLNELSVTFDYRQNDILPNLLA